MSQGPGWWSSDTDIHRIAELPQTIDDWSLTQIPVGLWLSTAVADVPPEVLSLAAEPGRVTVVVDADGPDPRTDHLLSQLFPMLSSAGLGLLRLVLSAAADRYAHASRAYGLDLIAAEAAVTITPLGYAIVRGGELGGSELRAGELGAGELRAGELRAGELAGSAALPQWRRTLPSGEYLAAGMLSPSPAWEAGLAVTLAADPGYHGTVRRVPAGLAMRLPGADTGFARAAHAVWPDPERVTVVVDGAGPREALHDNLALLLERLPLADTDGVRLHWPRAGAGPGSSALAELATRSGTDLIAPTADVTVSGFGGVCHGPAGAAPWLRFTRAGGTQVLGSLYPTPPWELGLAAADLSGLGEASGGLVIEHVAAGLCLYRPGSADRGLVATARSVIPDPDWTTMVVSGDARSGGIRQEVETVLGRLPAAASNLRLVLSGAGAGGPDSYAQFLADTFGGHILAPAGGWTASPNGRLRAFAVAGSGGPEPEDDGWQAFSPRPPPGAPEFKPPDSAPAAGAAPVAATGAAPVAAAGAAPVAAAGAAPVAAAGAAPVAAAGAAPVQEARPHQPPGPPDGAADEPEPSSAAEPALEAVTDIPRVGVVHESPVPPDGPPSGGVALLSPDHRSSAEERRLYRESASQYQAYAVAVRRMLTQRPGLRAGAAGEAEDALVTDFAAVLDYLDDDHYAVAAALRSAGTVGDPRTACALSGLRRLPSLTGAVFCSASLPGADTTEYVTGRTLVEPAFVSATSSRLVALDGDVEYVIWSETGKRAAALAAEAGRDEVIFAAGTTYRVLQVNAAGPGSGRTRVFLRELATSRRGRSSVPPAARDQPEAELDEMDRRALERLVAAAALRDNVPADDQVFARWGGSAAQPIGLNARGIPFPDSALGTAQ